jgi:hypothetical protein
MHDKLCKKEDCAIFPTEINSGEENFHKWWKKEKDNEKDDI